MPQAVMVLIVCFPFAAWWLIGDLNEVGRPGDLDYIVQAPDVNETLVAVVGTACLVLTLLALGIVLHAIATARADPRWITVALLGVLAGLVLAGGLRLVTAGTVGANIGGGITILFGPPLLLLLAISAFTIMRQIRKRSVQRELHPRTRPIS